MEMLILWGVPVLTALRGLNRRLFHSYLTFCNLLFSVYVALWSEPVISKYYSLPAEAAAFKPAVSMLVAAFVTFLVLYKVVEQLHPETQREFSFPRPIDKLGGGVCGFLTGMVLINFLAFLLCTVPQKQAVSGVVSLPELERAATTVVGTYGAAGPLGAIRPLDSRLRADFFVLPQDGSAAAQSRLQQISSRRFRSVTGSAESSARSSSSVGRIAWWSVTLLSSTSAATLGEKSGQVVKGGTCAARCSSAAAVSAIPLGRYRLSVRG